MNFVNMINFLEWKMWFVIFEERDLNLHTIDNSLMLIWGKT